MNRCSSTWRARSRSCATTCASTATRLARARSTPRPTWSRTSPRRSSSCWTTEARERMGQHKPASASLTQMAWEHNAGETDSGLRDAMRNAPGERAEGRSPRAGERGRDRERGVGTLATRLSRKALRRARVWLSPGKRNSTSSPRRSRRGIGVTTAPPRWIRAGTGAHARHADAPAQGPAVLHAPRRPPPTACACS